MENRSREADCVNKDLVMYYPPDLEIIFVPTERDYVMEFLDTVSMNKLLQMHQDIRDKAAGGFYDRI